MVISERPWTFTKSTTRCGKLRLRDFEITLSAPLKTAKGEISARRGTLIRVEVSGQNDTATDLQTGIGEATPLPGWTESVTDSRNALRECADESPSDALTELGSLPAARHGISLAVLDGQARMSEQSLATYLATGGETRDTVPVNATIGTGSPGETANEAEQAVEAGFKTLKVKVGGQPLSTDVTRVRAVRESVPQSVSVRVDANGGWDSETALEAVEAFSTLDIEYVEQPVSAACLETLADLRGRGVEIAVDETLASHDSTALLAADAADVLVLKPMVLGGVDTAREIAMEAGRKGVDTVVTTTIDAAVARTAAVHLAASLPSVRACGFATADMLEDDLVTDPIPVENGSVRVPQDTGTAGDRFDHLV